MPTWALTGPTRSAQSWKGASRSTGYSVEGARRSRIVYSVAKPRDPYAHGVHVQPQAGAVWLVPKADSRIPYWGSHTYVETQEHAVDAITGADGYPAGQFLRDHWEFVDTLRVSSVDPATVDAGIQELDDK